MLTPSTPVVAVLLLGVVIGLCTFSRQPPRLPRLSKSEKRVSGEILPVHDLVHGTDGTDSV